MNEYLPCADCEMEHCEVCVLTKYKMRKALIISLFANLLLILFLCLSVHGHRRTINELKNIQENNVKLQTVYVNDVPYDIRLNFEVAE